MALDDELAQLTGIELFSTFDAEALRLLTYSAETQRLRAGDVIFRRNETSDGGYILASGSIALQSHDDGGPAEKIVRPWALLGETALLAPTRRPISAIAREPSLVLKVSRSTFHEILELHPATAARVRGLFKKRLDAFSKELKLSKAL